MPELQRHHNCVSIPFVSGREHSLGQLASEPISIFPFQFPSFRGGSTPDGIRQPSPRIAGEFQSPSFRGGSTPVRIQPRHGWPSSTATSFNPLRFGAGALPRTSRAPSAKNARFNPLRFGAAALPISRTRSKHETTKFQSPSFRGGSTPGRVLLRAIRQLLGFQSPSFRGGSTPEAKRVPLATLYYRVSIPFVSGREHSQSLCQ